MALEALKALEQVVRVCSPMSVLARVANREQLTGCGILVEEVSAVDVATVFHPSRLSCAQWLVTFPTHNMSTYGGPGQEVHL